MREEEEEEERESRMKQEATEEGRDQMMDKCLHNLVVRNDSEI